MKKAVSDDTTVYESIMRRQATEIDRLNSQLQKSEMKNEKIIGDLQNELKIIESNHAHQISIANQQNELIRKTHSNEVSIQINTI